MLSAKIDISPSPLPVHRIFFAEILRTLAIFAVIILHNAADYGEEYGQIPISYWWSGTIWNGLVRFCVPMFVMLSGAFLLKKGKEVSIKEVFAKRLPKIFIPLTAWSIIYVLYAVYHTDEGIIGIDIKEQLKTFLEGPVIYHLWFLYMMIGIYLLYPIVNLFINSAKEVHVRYFLMVWFLTNCIFATLEILFDLNIGIDLSFFTGYVGYFVLGYYLYTYTFSQRQLKIAYMLGIIGFLLSVLFPYICILLNFENRAALIESDFTIDIVFAEIALFLWYKNRTYNEESKGLFKKSISEISKESFGIYLVHVLLMQIFFEKDMTLFQKFSALVDTWHPAWAIPVKSVMILILSYTIIKLIKQIPYVRKITE